METHSKLATIGVHLYKKFVISLDIINAWVTIKHLEYHKISYYLQNTVYDYLRLRIVKFIYRNRNVKGDFWRANFREVLRHTQLDGARCASSAPKTDKLWFHALTKNYKLYPYPVHVGEALFQVELYT